MLINDRGRKSVQNSSKTERLPLKNKARTPIVFAMAKFVQKEMTYEDSDLPNQAMRMRELILYISDKCRDNERFGATVLNKILWFSDFIAFQNTGKSITGEKYQRLRKGPAPRRLKPVQDKMIDDRELHIRLTRYGTKKQKRSVPLRDANLKIFTGEEIAIVDEVIDLLSHMNGTQISDWSHGKAWKTRNDGDLMPYELIFLSDEPVTASDISRTAQLVKEFGWDEYLTKTV